MLRTTSLALICNVDTEEIKYRTVAPHSTIVRVGATKLTDEVSTTTLSCTSTLPLLFIRLGNSGDLFSCLRLFGFLNGLVAVHLVPTILSILWWVALGSASLIFSLLLVTIGICLLMLLLLANLLLTRFGQFFNFGLIANVP
mgnify:FL=1